MTMTTKGAKRLLIADDYPDAASILSDLLDAARPGGYAGEVAADGRQALDLILVRHPVAALLDIEMPHLTGIEVALAVRRALGGHVVIVAMSGNPGSLDEAKASGAFDCCLSKPVDLNALLAFLDAVLPP